MNSVNKIRVGISDYKWGTRPDQLVTIGLGSCVGIALYDEDCGIGGLSHIMLPDSRAFSRDIKVAKFADLAIPALVQELTGAGARIRRLKAKIAGGASMFTYSDKSLNMNIGERNVEAVQQVLRDLGIPVLSAHTGGNTGRTMTLYLDTMNVGIRMASQPEFTL